MLPALEDFDGITQLLVVTGADCKVRLIAPNYSWARGLFVWFNRGNQNPYVPRSLKVA